MSIPKNIPKNIPSVNSASTADQTRVYLVDDHQLFLDGLRSLIENEEDIQLVGQSTDGKKALADLHALHQALHQELDVLVLDISMPESDVDGLEICKTVKHDYPALKVLVLTMHGEDRFINGLIGAGADGYILKNLGKEQMVDAIRSLMTEGSYFGKEITQKVMKRMQHRFSDDQAYAGEIRLTTRETEVLSLIGKGLKSKEVADALHIEKSTVETHKNNIREKLNLRDVKQMMIFARENGYTID